MIFNIKDKAKDLYYSNSKSGLKATNSQEAIDEVSGKVDQIAGNQMPQEYLEAAVDEYVSNNSGGFATKVNLEELESQLSSEIGNYKDDDFMKKVSDWELVSVASDGSIKTANNRISSFMFRNVKGLPFTITHNYEIVNNTPNTYYWVAKYDVNTKEFVELSYNKGYGNKEITSDGYYRITLLYADNREITSDNIQALIDCISVPSWTLNAENYGYKSITKDKLANDVFASGLSGKVMLNFGDSIAYGAGNDGVGYADMIAEKNAMILHDYSVSGITMAEREGVLLSVYSKVNTAISEVSNVDCVLLEGGTNDITHNIEIGTLSDDYEGTDLDTSTFLGSLESSLYNLRQAYPTATIIYVIVHKMTSRDITKQENFRNAIISACGKWCIPYVDIYKKGQITSYINSIASTCFPTDTTNETGYDRTHPKGVGYEKFYVPLIETTSEEYI